MRCRICACNPERQKGAARFGKTLAQRPFGMRARHWYFGTYVIRYLLLILTLGVGLPAAAQRYQRTLRGDVRIPSYGRQYYYIYYNADGSRISGSSVTQNKEGDLKAALVGRLSDDGTEMYLRETHSLDPVTPGMELCFFAARLKLTVYPDRRVWTGTFTSRQPNGEPCEGGTMTFVDLNPKAPPPPKPKPKAEPTPAVIKPVRPKAQPARDTMRVRRIQKPAVQAPPVRRDTVAATPVPEPIPPMPDTTSLKPFFYWGGAELRFEIWDGVQEDGDVVTVRFNGTPILQNHRLTLEKRTFTVPLSANSIDTLTVEMGHEGNLPANTVRLDLISTDKRYELALSGSYGDVKRFYFLRRRI